MIPIRSQTHLLFPRRNSDSRYEQLLRTPRSIVFSGSPALAHLLLPAQQHLPLGLYFPCKTVILKNLQPYSVPVGGWCGNWRFMVVRMQNSHNPRYSIVRVFDFGARSN